jgi:hypothetical protein
MTDFMGVLSLLGLGLASDHGIDVGDADQDAPADAAGGEPAVGDEPPQRSFAEPCIGRRGADAEEAGGERRGGS